MRTGLQKGRRPCGVALALAAAMCMTPPGKTARANEPDRESGSVSLLTGAGEVAQPTAPPTVVSDGTANPTDIAVMGSTPASTERPAAGAKEPEIVRRAPKRSAGKAGSNAASPAGARDLFKMLQPAGLVLLVIGVLTFVAKRWLPQARQAAGGGAAIQVLAKQHLSAKQSLCLVRLGRGLVLLGVTPDRISTVAQIQDPDEVAEVVTRIEQTRGRSFTQTMTRFSSRTAEPVDAAEDADDAEPIVRGGGLDSSQERIREMVRRVRAMTEAGPDGGQRGSRRESA